MAQLCERWSDNAPGRFYVDTECIVCTVCAELAPEHFRLAEDEDHDVCFRQPVAPEEVAACVAAMAACPAEAIGDDG